MQPIFKELYQFTDYIEPMNFTMLQYLLLSNPIILFATGIMEQAKINLPKIKKLLNRRKLKYIFVSHMESDECGGLSVFINEYPDITIICSSLCARELPGYGYKCNIIIVSEENELCNNNLNLSFFLILRKYIFKTDLYAMKKTVKFFILPILC